MSSVCQAIVTRCASVLVPGLLLCAVPGPVAAGEIHTMPPGAFLRTPVTDVTALTRELKADTLVTSRYSRLLHLSPDLVRAAFTHLHLMRLKHDMFLEVHYVHAHETIGSKVRRVRKGTPVFALPDGTPLLAQVCGNPLRGGVPKMQLILHPNSEEGPRLFDPMAASGDIPDFDPTEPQNTPAFREAVPTITMRDAPPPIEVLPDTALEPVETPPPPRTVAEAGNSLQTWVGGGVLLGTVVALEGSNPVSDVPVILRSGPRPVLTPPGITPARISVTNTVTPEPGGPLLALALAAAAWVHKGRRPRKPR